MQGEEARGEEARGEEARGEEEWEPERRSVQGEEGRPEEHQERPRSRSDEWLTFRAPEPLATAGTPPHRLEPLEYDLDLSKEVQREQYREQSIAINPPLRPHGKRYKGQWKAMVGGGRGFPPHSLCNGACTLPKQTTTPV